jgi:DNA-binding NarL/FixJ family response regulator
MNEPLNGPEQAPRLKVLIVAESLPTRAGLRLALEDEADCVEISGNGAVDRAVREQPAVCLVSLDSPRALNIVRQVSTRLPNTAVIVLTKEVEEREFLAAMRAGATGYLSDGIDPARLPYVVRSALRGEAPVPRHVVGKLLDELRGLDRGRRVVELPHGRRVALTVREWEVTDLLRSDLTTREIATRLDISPVTVRRHLTAAYAKLGVASRAEAVALVDGLPAPASA